MKGWEAAQRRWRLGQDTTPTAELPAVTDALSRPNAALRRAPSAPVRPYGADRPPRIDARALDRYLADEISYWHKKGYRVVSSKYNETIMSKGHPVNHSFHVIMTAVTFCFAPGLWLIVWALCAWLKGIYTVIISVNELGFISVSHSQRSTNESTRAERNPGTVFGRYGGGYNDQEFYPGFGFYY